MTDESQREADGVPERVGERSGERSEERVEERPGTNPEGRSGSGPSRRRLLAAGGAVAATGLAGCAGLDFLTGSGPAQFDAELATVSDAALAETGYELHDIEEDVRTREFEAAGQTRDVQVTNQMAEYDRGVDLFGERLQAAVFSVLSTPQVNVLGRTFNPVGDMSSEELAELIQDRYEGIRNVEERSEYTTTILGEDVRIVQYDADAQLAESGFTVDLRMHIADPIEAGEDFVIALGAYPRIIGDGDAVRTLFNGIEHPGV